MMIKKTGLQEISPAAPSTSPVKRQIDSTTYSSSSSSSFFFTSLSTALP